jgi:Cyclin, N-terminal domain
MRIIPQNTDDDYFLEISSYLLSRPSPSRLAYPTRPELLEFLSFQSTNLSLSSETFFESVKMFDLIDIHDFKNALVCLWISSKIHDNYGHVPLLQTLCGILGLDRKVLIKLEIEILQKINFESGRNVEEFIRIYSTVYEARIDLARMWGEALVILGYSDSRECGRLAVYLAKNGGDRNLLTPWIREKVSGV